MELTYDLNDKSYRDMIIELKGRYPLWVVVFSDRAAFSILREGFNSLDDLTSAIEGGLDLSQIPNLGWKEVEEIHAIVHFFN